MENNTVLSVNKILRIYNQLYAVILKKRWLKNIKVVYFWNVKVAFVLASLYKKKT